MKVLVACEFSGIVRDAFIKLGHDAMSCDLLPTERLGPHYQGDVRDVLGGGWDLMIAHPPCTYLASSGVQHLHKQPGRWQKMKDARDFFMLLYNAPIVRVCVENPLPHRYAELPAYSQIVQPYHFGDEASKRTCLWLRGLAPLFATNIVGKGERYIGKDGKPNGAMWYQMAICATKTERWKIRSRTFQGIADAMAMQWGGVV